ncbi:unnamed protein product [Caenorhabditis sp. 36 PRJEB53466]|nr:unnamed protein product [Caenorhabditis sp. 36 PRJEB53466]
MVFGFFSTSVDPPALIFMGEHQKENERLLRMEFSDDVWFHVENLSSAHVYLRMPRGMSIETIPEQLLEECCQLAKKNSISGCKLDSVSIVYTIKANLKKEKGMADGQVGFHKVHLVRKRKTDKNNGIAKRLEKTRWRERIADS